MTAGVVLATVSARAAGVPAPPGAAAPAPAVKAEARQRFDEGIRLFDKGENAAALAEFKRAYELIPNVLVLYNIALVYAAMDRPVDAVDALDKVLADKQALAPAQVQKAQQTLGEQSARVAEVAVVTDKPAVVEVDGVDRGRTPLAHPLRIASGTHVITALAPGCLPARQEITLAGRTAQTVTFALLPTESSNAHLTFSVSVPGAEVLVNGRSAGTTPLPTSVAVTPGAAEIEVRRAGYRSDKRTLRVDEGSNGAVSITLDEDPAAPASLKGRLRVTPSEPDATVSVDGLPRPGAAAGLPVVSGPHAVRVERAGFLTFERTVDVAAGAETSLVAALTPTPETLAAERDSAHKRQLVGWSLVGGGAALAVGAAIYAVVTRDNVGNAQANLNTQVMMEMDSKNVCSSAPGNMSEYNALGCGAIKAAYEDDLSSAKLHRDLAYAGIGVGVVAAGVGAYLLATTPEVRMPGVTTAHLGAWGDGQSGGLVVHGAF